MPDDLFRAPAKLGVHPLADIFPMLDEDELADLAADIKANGLQIPIMLDAAGKVLVDGRNRLAACKIVGVEPTFDRLRDGEDAAAFIVSANLRRRNLSKGQQAMLLATAHPEPGKGGRGKKNSLLGEGFSAARLSQARTILRDARDLAELVITGTTPLNAAYTEAQRRQNAANSEQQKLARLQAEAPDFAALVTEERMTLAEAVAALDQRNADRQRIIDIGRRAADRVLDFCAVAVSIAGAAEHGERGLIDPEKLKQLDDAMTLLRRIYEQEGGS